MHNYIQSDRYRPTDYVDEKSMLGVKKNKAYTLDESKMYTKCIQDVSVGKDSIGKVRLGEDSIVKDSKGESVRGEKTKRFIPPSVEEVEQYCIERNNNIDAQSFIDFYESKGWMIGKNKMKDWKAAVRTWERSRKQENKENVFDEWRNA
jgi:hypothetical protein